jgi:hypothetical protein
MKWRLSSPSQRPSEEQQEQHAIAKGGEFVA